MHAAPFSEGILVIPDCVGKFFSAAVSPDYPLNAHLVDRRSTYARAADAQYSCVVKHRCNVEVEVLPESICQLRTHPSG